MRYDFVIVGGGIVGLMTALQLIEQGGRVLIVDQGEIGKEATWASGGILSPLYPWKELQPVQQLCLWGQEIYPKLVGQWEQESGVDSEWIESGLLNLDIEDEPAALEWGQRNGQAIEIWEPPEIKEMEPALRMGTGSAIYYAKVGHVRPPRLIEALRLSLVGKGGEIRQGTRVVSIQERDGRALGVRTEEGDIGAENVIIAAGAWTDLLLEDFGVRFQIEPVRGQMILFRSKPGILKSMVLHKGVYLIPRKDGHILAGSTVEYVGFDKSTTTEALKKLKENAYEMLPREGLGEVVRQWSGLRPGSKTGIPYIGAHPKMKNLYINSGHFRNGIQMAPGSARLLADMILERTPILDPEPYQKLWVG